MSYGTPSQSSSKLSISNNYNSLISLELDHQKIMNLYEPERIEYFTKIKKQANYFLLSAFRALEEKNYKVAKDILVYVADSCSCIHPPDKESQELIELCCEQLAQIKRIEDWTLQHSMNKKILNERETKGTKLEIFVMKYNKFSGEFKCDEQQKKTISPEVLFYLSKINSILFGEQTTQNLNSMLAMLKLYSIEIFFLFIIIFLIIATSITNIKSSMFGLPDSTVNYPTIIVASLFILPLLVIFFKSPIIKDSQFFLNKLSLQIKKINQECKDKGHKIVFMMPEGMELNVKVQYDIDEAKEDNMKIAISRDKENAQNQSIQLDLSNIRKRVTHYYEKASKNGKIGEIK